MSGKGDKRRPTFISYKEWDNNYNQIFQKRNHEFIEPPPKLSAETIIYNTLEFFNNANIGSKTARQNITKYIITNLTKEGYL